jgi:5,10-methylenetetrahydrofolate reductase
MQVDRRGGRIRSSTLPRMRIDEIIASVQPCFSVEFFPPKTDEGREQLLDTARQLS